MGAPKLSNRSFFEEDVGKHFIDAAVKTIEGYLNNKPSVSKTNMSIDLKIAYPIAGLINFTANNVQVQMLLAVNEVVAMEMFAAMVGDQPNSVDSDVLDCVGEVTNMVYGYAKALLVNDGHLFTLARPIVVNDPNERLKGKKSLEVQFNIKETTNTFSLIFSL